MHAIPEDFRKHLRPGIQDASGFRDCGKGNFSKSIFFDDSAPSKLDTFETVSFSRPPRPQKQRLFGFSHKNAWISQVCWTENITWCNGFWTIFKKCLFLKTSISGIPPKEQFWIFWESKNLFVFPMFLIKWEVGKTSRVSEKSFVFPMFLNAFRKRSLFKKWPFPQSRCPFCLSLTLVA